LGLIDWAFSELGIDNPFASASADWDGGQSVASDPIDNTISSVFSGVNQAGSDVALALDLIGIFALVLLVLWVWKKL
jgi:hypothetical protein